MSDIHKKIDKMIEPYMHEYQQHHDYAQGHNEQMRKQVEFRREIMKYAPIQAEEFLTKWCGNGRNAVDYPGCYVIIVNPSTKENGDVCYEDVYVGQSIHVVSRIRQHLTGHGNGDVYADVREGKDVQIRIAPCDKQDLNRVEKELISVFNATSSYNRTQGGSKRR